MWGYMLLAMVLIGFGTIASHTNMAESSNIVQAEVAALVGNALVYRNSVVSYAAANPSFSGTVPDIGLGLPSWYRKMDSIHHYMVSGQGYVYFSGMSGSTAYSLVKAMGNSIKAGVKVDGNLINPLSSANFSDPIALPSAIPDTSVVLIP